MGRVSRYKANLLESLTHRAECNEAKTTHIRVQWGKVPSAGITKRNPSL
jgi:hypothetical protein